MKEQAIASLDALKIELPSWGFADTGTRFGKFLQDGSAIDTADKFADAGMVNRLTACCPAVAVHVLWDFSESQDGASVAAIAAKNGVEIGSINANLFQDQEYKLGSFGNPELAIRQRALQHSLDCIQLGKDVGSDLFTLWFADGTNYPGQDSIRDRKRRFQEGLRACHERLSESQVMLVEYKPFEPAFYHTDIADWGMSYLLCKDAGPQAKVLVDTGHHYASQNIEQIVAWLLDENMLGGFHFNDRRFADDDLTLGSIDPYQVFRIFNEIHSFAEEEGCYPDIAHNLKPKIEAMLQTVMTAQDLWLKAALVDRSALKKHQRAGAIVDAENVLKTAFNTNVDGLLAGWRAERGVAANPLDAYRASGYGESIAKERSQRRKDLGIKSGAAYA